jgi:hypothetical protein
LLRLLAIAFGLLVLTGALLMLMVPGGFVDHIPVYRWSRGGDPIWPVVEHVDLAVRLTSPGEFAASGTYRLSGIEDDVVRLLLNEDLDVTTARWGEREVRVGHGLGLKSRYHSEGRVVHLHLPETPPDGRAELHLTWAGKGEWENVGSDWRGILYIGGLEARMCEQTVFVPHVPLSVEGPAVQEATFTLTVDVRKEWEVVTSAPQTEPPRKSEKNRRLWSFAATKPTHPAILAGAWARSDREYGGALITCLLTAEHADMAEEILGSTLDSADALAAAYGPAAGGSLAIVEQRCRGGWSYNWTTDGLIVMDEGALNAHVPHASLAHEVSHLWWGQAVEFDGPGERFLTEGGAEASSWLALQATGRIEERGRALRSARRALERLSSAERSVALAEVGFGTPDYDDLAYQKGALVHRWVAGMLGPERLRELGTTLLDAGAQGPVTLDTWRETVRRLGDGLEVPWLDHPGGLELSLHDLSVDGGSVRGRVQAEGMGADDPMPPRVRAVVEVVGRGFTRRAVVEVDGSAEFAVDLSDLDEPKVQSVHLDPDDLMPTPVFAQEVLDGSALVESSPAQGADDVAMGLTEIVVEFDRPLLGVSKERWYAERPLLPSHVRTPKVLALDFEEDGRRLRFAVRPLAPDQEWWLPLRGALRDAHGGPPMTEHLVFHTAPSDDDVRPVIVSVDPPQGSTVSPTLQEVVVTWSEPMQSGTGYKTYDIEDMVAGGVIYPDIDFGEWDDSGTVLTIPITSLEPGTDYGLPMGAAYRDLSGNSAEREDVTFTTGPLPEGP